jgi:hypothetical protein
MNRPCRRNPHTTYRLKGCDVAKGLMDRSPHLFGVSRSRSRSTAFMQQRASRINEGGRDLGAADIES